MIIDPFKEVGEGEQEKGIQFAFIFSYSHKKKTVFHPSYLKGGLFKKTGNSFYLSI